MVIRSARITGKCAILVLGAHRSGTSLVTRILNLLGFHLGRDLLGSHECNTSGLWENAALVAWNEAFLSGLGSSWLDYRLLSVGQGSHAFASAVQSLATVLQEQFGEAEHIAIKDPRICRLVPLYAEALQLLGYDVRALVQHRLPLKTALSLYRRDGLPVAAGMRLWLSHMLQVLESTQGWNRFFVGYSDLLQAPEEETLRIASWLSHCDERSVAASTENIVAFVNPLLETVTSSAVDLSLLEQGVNRCVTELYKDLSRARDSALGGLFSLLDHWLSCYRSMSTDTYWQSCPLVVVLHADVNDKPEYLQYLRGLARHGAGLLVVKDGEELDAEDGGWAKCAIASGTGLLYNRVVRGESPSLVRGVGLSLGHDVLLLKRVVSPLASSIIGQLEGELANAGRVIILIDAARACSIELDLAQITPDACVGLFLPKAVATGIDPWRFINSEGDAMTLLMSMLGSGTTKVERLVVNTNSV